MDLTHIMQSQKRKKSKRVGRGPGSGTGKTSGRGQKGQKSRSGGGSRIGFEGGQMPLYRRLPKRGFTSPAKKEYEIINVDSLNVFNAKTTVNAETLLEKGLIRKKESLIKILGNGELEKELTVHAHKFSTVAIEKIEAKNGKIEIIKKVESDK